MIEYTYPVTIFYGDDPEDAETTYSNGRITNEKQMNGGYEADIKMFTGCYHLVVGHCETGTYLCIPERHSGCRLYDVSHTDWNIEEIMHNEENLCYEEACAIAYAIRELCKVFKVQW